MVVTLTDDARCQDTESHDVLFWRHERGSVAGRVEHGDVDVLPTNLDTPIQCLRRDSAVSSSEIPQESRDCSRERDCITGVVGLAGSDNDLVETKDLLVLGSGLSC